MRSSLGTVMLDGPTAKLPHSPPSSPSIYSFTVAEDASYVMANVILVEVDWVDGDVPCKLEERRRRRGGESPTPCYVILAATTRTIDLGRPCAPSSGILRGPPTRSLQNKTCSACLRRQGRRSSNSKIPRSCYLLRFVTGGGAGGCVRTFHGGQNPALCRRRRRPIRAHSPLRAAAVKTFGHPLRSMTFKETVIEYLVVVLSVRPNMGSIFTYCRCARLRTRVWPVKLPPTALAWKPFPL